LKKRNKRAALQHLKISGGPGKNITARLASNDGRGEKSVFGEKTKLQQIRRREFQKKKTGREGLGRWGGGKRLQQTGDSLRAREIFPNSEEERWDCVKSELRIIG